MARAKYWNGSEWVYADASTGGGGAVDSVNAQTGAVVLDADDIDDTATTNKFATTAQLSKVDDYVPEALYWQFAGAGGSYIEAAYDVSFDVASDLELVWRQKQADWTPAAISMIASRRTSALVWQLALNTDGTFRFSLSTGSSAFYNSSIIAPSSPLVNGNTYWFKLLRNSTTGKVELLIAPDSPTEPDVWPMYCQNSGVQTAGVLDSGSIPIQIGSERSGVSTSTAGMFYFSMRDHDRTILAEWKAEGPTTDVAGNVWTTTGTGALESQQQAGQRDLGIPPLQKVWELDLSDAVNWETVNGQEFEAGSPFTSAHDATGVDGIAPTIKVDFDIEELEGVDRRFWFPSMGVAGRDEMFLRYKVHVPANDHWGGGGKMPGLAGKPADENVLDLAWGGSRPGDSWSVRTSFDSVGRIGLYLYVDEPVAPGYPYGQTVVSNRYFVEGWNEVVIRVDVARGEAQLWLNDQEALFVEGLTYLTNYKLPPSVLVMNHGYGGTVGDGPNVAQVYHHAGYQIWSPSKASLDDAPTNVGLGTLATQDDIAVPGDITATGTPSSTTFLRGDGAWAAPSGTSTKQPFYVIAANNAPTWAKDRADVVCDGTADQVEIQAALDLGYPVLLTQGLFVVSAQINITSLGLLRGMGYKTVIRAGSAYTSGDQCVIGSKNNSAVLWTIEDLAIDGAYNSVHGIRIYNTSQDVVDPPAPGSDNYGTIRNVLIEGTKGGSTAGGLPGTCAIWLDDNPDGLRSCNIMDIIIRGCDTCIYLQSSDHMVSNVHGNSDWDGLRLSNGASNCRFTNIKMFFCDNIGIKVESGARGNTFSACEVQDQNGIGYQIYAHETTMSACYYNIVSASRVTTTAFDIWCDGSTFNGLSVNFTTGSGRSITNAFDFNTSQNIYVSGVISNPDADFVDTGITGTPGTESLVAISRAGTTPYLSGY